MARKRKNEIHLFLSDDELKVLKIKMEAAHYKNQSSFIRNLIITGFVYDIDTSDFRQNNHLIAKIGNRINQIVLKANTYKEIPEKDIEEIKKGVSEIWQLQQSIQSQLQSINQ